MKVCTRRFNLYLALIAAVMFLGGCQTAGKHQSEKLAAGLRIYLQVSSDEAGDMTMGQTISVLRSNPVLVTIGRDPILTEAHIFAAKVINTPGGFAIEIQFDETGAAMLEQYSAANPGRYFAIFGEWDEKPVKTRWLAAPLITHRIANGVLSFTADCSREEADQFVRGLNNAAAKNRKGELK